MSPGGANWCDDISTNTAESCEQIILEALDSSIKELSKLQGKDMEKWEWGKVHTAVYSHTPFSEINILRPIFERRIASGGGPNTINVAGATFSGSDGYEQHFGPGFRQIMGLGNDVHYHLFMNSTGQSGNLFSKNYDDMIEPFRDVKYLEFSKKEPVTKLILNRFYQDNSVIENTEEGP